MNSVIKMKYTFSFYMEIQVTDELEDGYIWCFMQ